MVITENFEKIEIISAQQLRDWLMANNAQKQSVWLVTFKKNVPGKYVSRWDVLDELLCFGWIDGIRRKLDDKRTMQLISPRKAEHWAKTYKDRVAKLEDEGRMMPSGLKAIEISKDKGLWNFMDDVDALIKPPDLNSALEANPPAAEHFEAFAKSTKRFILRWIKLAKTPETRKKRIEKTSKLAAIGEKIPGS